MNSRPKIINISRLSLVVCLAIALLIVTNYKNSQVFYGAIKEKIMDITEPVLSSTSSMVHNVNNFVANIGSIFSLFEDNKQLKERNKFLEYYFYLYKQSEGENKALKEQLRFAESIKQKYLTGRIISKSNNHLHQQITVNIGRDVGVQKWQMVLANNSLFGRVIEVTKNTASILLITDYNSRIPVTSVSSRVKFIVGGQATEELECHYLNDKQLQEHELIVTSGDNEQIIPNIIVGTVINRDGHFHIKPNIDFSQIEFVQILQQTNE